MIKWNMKKFRICFVAVMCFLILNVNSVLAEQSFSCYRWGGHRYAEPIYTWSADKKTCTAERECENCFNKEIETTKALAAVVQEKSCTQPELTTYTATFMNDAFETQTKENIKTAEQTGHSYGNPSYTWSADNKTCTAERECKNCFNKETETTEALAAVVQEKSCTQPELTTYTVTFENSAFEAQIKENVKTAEQTGHSYGNPSYTWSADNKTCTAERECKNCFNKETETTEALATVVQEKNCTQPELTTYTVTFKNDAFEAQIKENVKIAEAAGHNLQKIAEKASTTEKEGNHTYWYCDSCKKYFSDEKAEKEIKQEDTVIAKLAPASDQEENATVTKDEKKELTSTTKTVASTEKITKAAAQTGDQSELQLDVVLLLASLGVAAGIAIKRKFS